MSKTKDEVAGAYAEATKEQFGDLRRMDYGRSALVIGADEANIGGCIADALDKSGRFGAGDDYGFVQRLHKGTLDASDPDNVATLDLSSFDTLVLANGFSSLDWLENAPLETIAASLNDNLLASQLMTQKFVNDTLGKPWVKDIVFIGSMAHRAILNGSSYYCAAKAGLAHFARCAAWELTPKGYRVFSVHPSNTAGTPMTEKTIEGIERYRGIDHESAENYWGAINLMPRWLAPQDIGEVVLWLVTNPAAEYLAGSDIELKAGQR